MLDSLIELHQQIDFSARRRTFQRSMQKDSVAIFCASGASIRSRDVYHRFRQDSNFFYLTGFNEEESILIITPDEDILYLRPHEKEREVWDGPRLGLERVEPYLNIARSRKIEDFEDHLEKILKNRSLLYYTTGRDQVRDTQILKISYEIQNLARAGDYGPESIQNPDRLIFAMRQIKSEAELQLMQMAMQATTSAHKAIMQATRPGMAEYELEAIIQLEFRRCNAVEAYPSIVASGVNACILHHIYNDRKYEAGELILVDAGAEKNCMATDITRTFPSDGRFTSAARDVYTIVLEAQLAAIDACRVGQTIPGIHDIALRRLAQGMLDLKLLKDESIDSIIETKKYQPFYMHRTGHWLGIDVHDVGPYYESSGKALPLKENMVTTVEPGLYISADQENAPIALRGIGVRIEDDIAIKAAGPLNLSAGIPRTIADIENWQSRAR